MVGIVLLTLLGACAGEMQQPPDSSGDPWTETGWTWPDVTPIPDSPGPVNTPDSYAGALFGCEQDHDCFGLRCCKTPWGVKLCASSCP